jgi:hypothetical protein
MALFGIGNGDKALTDCDSQPGAHGPGPAHAGDTCCTNNGSFMKSSLHYVGRGLEGRREAGANRSEGLTERLRPERQLRRLLVLSQHLQLIRGVLHELLNLLQLLQTDVFDLLELL